MDAARLIIPPDEVDVRLLAWWAYLVARPGRPLGLSPFGDWFLVEDDGRVWRVDLLEGSYDPLADSERSFWEQLRQDEQQDEWLQAGTVMAMQREGALRSRGECYTYVVHPRLGGAVRRPNVRLGKLDGWQIFCAQLHPQLDALPNGARVTRLDVDEQGRMAVQWVHERS